jgi:hypothetical protein
MKVAGMKSRGTLGAIGVWVLQSACGSSGGGALGAQANTDIVSSATDSDDSATHSDATSGETKGGATNASTETDDVSDASNSPSTDTSNAVSSDISSLASSTTSSTTSSGGASSGGASSGGASSEPSSEAPFGDPFDVSVHLAREEYVYAPTTVAIVHWTTTLGKPTRATIEFGLTTEYGTVAPVDATDAGFRGVLLGMKPKRTYHFRIVAEIDGKHVASDDYTVTTGEGPTAQEVGEITFEVADGRRQPGFILTSYWSGEQKSMVFILDQDGDVVWWYPSRLSHGVAKAAISADGRDLWMVSGIGFGSEQLRRVGMDGLGWEDYRQSDASHDIVAVEGDVMAFIDYRYNGIVEIDRSGWETFIVRTRDLPANDVGHQLTALSYRDGRYALSSREADVFVFPRRAEVQVEDTVSLTSLVGPAANWGGYHYGVELLPDNHLLLFANRAGGESGPSTVIEFDLDKAAEVWRHESASYTAQYGDAQRLPGGTTLITYSNEGLIQEVSNTGQVLLSVTASPFLGYSTWLPSLYGSP